MKSLDPSTAIPRLRILLAFVFMVLAGLAWMQTKQTRFILPEAPITKASWKADSVSFRPTRDNPNDSTTFLILGETYFKDLDHIPTLTCVLPPKSYDYRLNIRTHDTTPREPATLRIRLGSTVIGEYHSRSTLYDLPEAVDLNEILIPSSRAGENQEESTLTIECVGGRAWEGSLLLIPRASWRIPLQLMLPMVGWLLLATFACNVPGRKLFPWVLFIVLFAVYQYTLFTDKLDPMNHPLFKDSKDIMPAILENRFHFYMMKHPLFLFVMHGAWKLLHLFTTDAWRAVSLVLSGIAACNAVVAYGILKRVLKNHALSVLAVLIYSFSFSIWLFSSVCETYIFSTLIVNVTLLATLALNAERPRFLVYTSALLVACGLAHPPMMIIFGFGAIRWIVANVALSRRLLLGPALIAVVAGYLIGQAGFHYHYDGVDPFKRGVTEDLSSDHTISAQVKMTENIIKHYAAKEDNFLTMQNIGNLLIGQFYNGLGGQPWPYDWSQGWRGLRAYFSSPTGIIFVLILTVLYGLATWSTFRGDLFGRTSLLAFLIVGIPYLGFFAFFNAREMIIHSAPMILPILVWIHAGIMRYPRLRIATVLCIFSAVTMLHNTLCLLSYH